MLQKHLTLFLMDLHGDLRVCQDKLQTFIRENKMALDPQVEAALTGITDGIATEIDEIKKLVTPDQTELLQRLEGVKSAIASISDNVSAPQPEG